LTFPAESYILFGMEKRVKNPVRSRRILLESALREIHHKGYKAASVNDILAQTGLTRGALYHHFPNKRALGFAALEGIEEGIRTTWIERLQECEDPIDALQDMIRSDCGHLTDEDIALGCPLNNLAQEMSALDDGFRQRVVRIYNTWRQAIADSLRQGQQNGTVNRAIDPVSTATFLVASLSGGRGLAKTAQSAEMLAVCTDNLARYIETLRP
jgi:TetR/AcrR family transcriptional repressor of nem operon